MLRYKDMTFCPAGDCDNFGQCFRELTEKVKHDAELADMPIARFANPEKLECYNTNAKGQP